MCIYTHVRNAVTLVWGLLKLAISLLHANKIIIAKYKIPPHPEIALVL